MNKHLEKLREVDRHVYDNMGTASQKIIDIVKETIEGLDRDYEEKPVHREELGAISYEIDTLLEIWNFELLYDIEVLERVDKILKDWIKEIEFVNGVLGIDKTKG